MEWKGVRGAFVGKLLLDHFNESEELIAKLLKTETGRQAISSVTRSGGVPYWERRLKERLILG